MQDNFIGNLRGAKPGSNAIGSDSFLSALRSTRNPAVDTPNGYWNVPMTEPRTIEQNLASKQGTLYVQPSDIAKNSSYQVQDIKARPMTEKDWENFESGINDFRVVLDAYSNEPDQNARIKLLENSAPKFKNSEKLLRYLRIMHEDEVANRDKTALPDFDYKTVKPAVEDAIEGVLTLRYKKT